MRGPLAALLFLAMPAAAQAPAFDDSGVRVSYEPSLLWRGEQGQFLGRREGTKLVLVYDFFDAQGRRSCPSDTGRGPGAPSCERIQDAVGRAIELWGEASGRLVLRRRRQDDAVNIWIAWTRVFDRGSPVARAVDGAREALQAPGRGDEGYQGFSRVAYPGERKEFAGLFFNDKFCWHLEDASACPSPPPLPNGKVIEHKHDVRKVALHEAGHVLGFGHFTVPSIMGAAGGTERYELTPYDREAIRILYERVDASVPIQ